jgi:hypothetical protein
MRTSTERVLFESGEPHAGPGRSVRYILSLAWALVRVPVAALLAICEPLVPVVLAGLALLFLLIAGFFALVLPLHAFPFFGMLGAAMGLILLLALYYALLRAFSA